MHLYHIVKPQYTVTDETIDKTAHDVKPVHWQNGEVSSVVDSDICQYAKQENND